MKKIVFEYSKGWNDTIIDILEYKDNVTEEEIQQDFEEWVWNIIGDSMTWYEEE